MDSPSSPQPWYTSAHARALYERGASAREIADRVAADGYRRPAESTVRDYGRKHWQRANEFEMPLDGDDFDERLADAKEKMRRIAEAGLVAKAVGIRHTNQERDGTWDAQVKGGGISELESHRTESGTTLNVTLDPTRFTDGLIEITPAPRLGFEFLQRRTVERGTVSKDWMTLTGFPDLQAWYVQDENGIWYPCHDEAAVNASHQVLAYVDDQDTVDVVIDHGDLGDWPNMSKHKSLPSQLNPHATNRTTRRIGEILGERTVLTPRALERWVIRGNHDDRPMLWMQDNAPQLVGIRDAEGTLLLSLDNLYGLSGNGWTSTDPYPHGIVRLSHNFVAVHGPEAKATPGGTGAEYLRKRERNVCFGHSPHMQIVAKTVADGPETRTYIAVSGGGLMRTDGFVSSMKSRGDESGFPLPQQAEAWEQGIHVIQYDPEGHWTPRAELVHIVNGETWFRGERFRSTVDVNGNAL